MPSSLPYHEPSITQLLTLSSFLLALNSIDALLDRALYCGLVGQVLVGIAFGAPGANVLSSDLQTSVAQLGYLGLILIVFEGGAATSVAAVKRNLALSAAVAATGVGVPLALSFAALGPLVDGADSVKCFAAGAALASTSLGTTFSVLAASGLAETRLGSVLGTAAMMDDVLGLVMVQVVSSLGAGNGGEEEEGEVRIDVGEAVLRPVFVSLGFAVVVPLVCRFVVRPVVLPFLGKRGGARDGKEKGSLWWQPWRLLDAKQTAFVAQTALLVALVVAASYAGASVLLAAYLAGIVVSWWDSQRDADETKERRSRDPQADSPREWREPESHEEESTGSRVPGASAVIMDSSGGDTSSTSQSTSQLEHRRQHIAGHKSTEIYEAYYSQAVNRILKPFFFASIGFSIPISNMFSGEVVWRGIIYSILMAIGKLMCGLWLVRFPVSASGLVDILSSFVSSRYRALLSLFSRFRRQRTTRPSTPTKTQTTPGRLQLETIGPTTATDSQTPENNASRNDEAVSDAPQEPQRSASVPGSTTPAKPLSLYPAAIVSCAMVARGEIGFLVSAVAESNGVFRQPSDGDGTSELFLVVTWAIVLCTIVGPICVGLLVRRVKKLESKAASPGERGTRDVLGVWGVS
ncbi:Sodium/hydrogen exchanger family-domain-containing protein [Hypomontagnella submonticulosa]|nr:Sodium/hydrogen exchanger family-domain-containing protein [Hypomontagnella submonticulosa]